MTPNDLTAIFKQIIIDQAYYPGRQINTFRVTDQMPPLHHDSLGGTYTEFLEGNFWSRTWVNQGADPEKITGEYPVLFVEQQELGLQPLEPDLITACFYLLFLDKLPCDSCPPNVSRSPAAVKENTVLMARDFLSELFTFALYEVEDGAGITYQWLSAGRQAWLETQPGIIGIDFVRDLLTDFSEQEVRIGAWGTDPAIRGTYMRICFSLCWPIAPAYNYKNEILPQLATTVCPC